MTAFVAANSEKFHGLCPKQSSSPVPIYVNSSNNIVEAGEKYAFGLGTNHTQKKVVK